MDRRLPGRPGAPHGRLAGLLVLVLLIPAARAGPAATARLEVQAPAHLAGRARRARELAGPSLAKIARRLGLPEPGRVTIHLADGEDQLPPELAGRFPPWAAGVAFPGTGDLAIRLDRLQLHPSGDLKAVLDHELVHVAMGVLDEKELAKLPWWFHEGVAQALTGATLFHREADLADLAAAGRLRDLYRLGVEENAGQRATDLAYQQAWSFALFLEQRLGADFFARLLAALPGEPDFNRAFLRATSLSYVVLEEDWKAFLARQPGATMQRLAEQFFLILLVLALPLVSLALIRRFRREDEIERSWAAEEAGGGLPAGEGGMAEVDASPPQEGPGGGDEPRPGQ